MSSSAFLSRPDRIGKKTSADVLKIPENSFVKFSNLSEIQFSGSESQKHRQTETYQKIEKPIRKTVTKEMKKV
jgi:hypothetical protein